MRQPARTLTLDALGAVLVGNAAYFLLLFEHLPAAWQHQPFAPDRGLGLDFLLCGGVFGVVRWVRGRFDAPRTKG